MCMKATPEGCELRDELKEIKTATAALDTRLTKVEHDLGSMRSETQEGIRALTASVANLAHDFGQRMNTLDARIVAEKEKWGDTLRGIGGMNPDGTARNDGTYFNRGTGDFGYGNDK